jgi:hypothetical protein
LVHQEEGDPERERNLQVLDEEEAIFASSPSSSSLRTRGFLPLPSCPSPPCRLP